MSNNNQEVDVSQDTKSIKFEKLLRDFAIFSLILFVYVTFFSKPNENIQEYANKMIGEQRIMQLEAHELATQSLKITLNTADASICDIASTTVQSTSEDNAHFFNKKNLDRIWTEIVINDKRLDNITWTLTDQGNDFILYTCSVDQITITQRYTIENCIISVKTTAHNAGEDALIKILFCTGIDTKNTVQTGFKTSLESGFSTRKLDLSTIGKHVQHIQDNYVGVIKKYWLICMRNREDKCANISMWKINNQIFIVNQAIDSTVCKNKSIETNVEYYAGPRDAKILESHIDRFGINLVHNIDHGWLSWINALIRIFIEWLINLCGRADVALLAFILLMRILLIYPYIIAEKNARMIALLADKVNKIKSDYPSEIIATEKIQALYKLYGVNERIAKIPMFIQMLWFIPLNIMSQLFSFRDAQFFGIIKDMSALDHTSWTNLFGLMPWSAYNIRFINFGVWMVIFTGTYIISEDMSHMDKIFVIIMILSTILIYKNLPVLFALFWCIVNVIGAIQVRCFKKFLHPRISI